MERKYFKAIPRKLSTNDFWAPGREMFVPEHYLCLLSDVPRIKEVSKEEFEEFEQCQK